MLCLKWIVEWSALRVINLFYGCKIVGGLDILDISVDAQIEHSECDIGPARVDSFMDRLVDLFGRLVT